jgi:hypothetical protein
VHAWVGERVFKLCVLAYQVGKPVEHRGSFRAFLVLILVLMGGVAGDKQWLAWQSGG